jgi:hypothetical protein
LGTQINETERLATENGIAEIRRSVPVLVAVEIDTVLTAIAADAASIWSHVGVIVETYCMVFSSATWSVGNRHEDVDLRLFSLSKSAQAMPESRY